jgi:hypothetical protein
MITKGYVIKKSTDNPNKYLIRIPVFENAGIGLTQNQLNSSIVECTLAQNPGTYEGLNPGDAVFVGFEDNLYSKPIILGKLYKGIEDNASAYQYNVDLKVTHKATLPIDTTIGNVPFDNVLNYFDSINTAIDRLSTQKDGAASLILYPTTASADVSGYFKMVNSLDDPSYNTTPVNIPTGVINTNNQLLASLISDSNILSGFTGIINIRTVGNIKRTVGNNNQFAAFYFTISKRSISGTETLLVTSSATPDVIIQNIYEEFSADALLNDVLFLSTDRIVIKYYAQLTGNVGSNYDFQFGGTSPVRTLFPIPLSTIATPKALNILTNTSNFNNILSSADNTVQKALDKLDDHIHDNRYFTETESDNRYLKLTGGSISGNLSVSGTTSSALFYSSQTNGIGYLGSWNTFYSVLYEEPFLLDLSTIPGWATVLSSKEVRITVDAVSEGFNIRHKSTSGVNIQRQRYRSNSSVLNWTGTRSVSAGNPVLFSPFSSGGKSLIVLERMNFPETDGVYWFNCRIYYSNSGYSDLLIEGPLVPYFLEVYSTGDQDSTVFTTIHIEYLL